jgi:hypothetical protein
MGITEDQVLEFIAAQAWTYSKSYPRNPHDYVVKEFCAMPELWDGVVQYIREYGQRERFYRAQYMYLYIGEWKYWTMGAPIERLSGKTWGIGRNEK